MAKTFYTLSASNPKTGSDGPTVLQSGINFAFLRQFGVEKFFADTVEEAVDQINPDTVDTTKVYRVTIEELPLNG